MKTTMNIKNIQLKFKLFSIIIFMFLVFVGCKKDDRVYNVLVADISKNIHLKYSDINNSVMVLRELHEQLFVFGNNGITSNILKSWEANSDYTDFRLCIKEGILFSNGKVLTIEDIIDNFKFFRSNDPYMKSVKELIRVDAKCMLIKFMGKYPKFFSYMSNLNKSIIDMKTLNEQFPIGISPYRIDTISDNEIKLKHTGLTSPEPYFKEIIYEKYDEKKEYKRFNYEEINYLPLPIRENIISSNYLEYLNDDIAAQYLLINHEDINIRDLIYDCIDRETLFKIFYPGRIYKKLNYILPVGIFGKNMAFEQNCNKQKQKRYKTKIVLKMLSFGDTEDVIKNGKMYLNNLLNKYNIFVDLVIVSLDKCVEIFKSNEKDYNLAIISTASKNPEDFFTTYGFGQNNERFVGKYDIAKINLYKDYLNSSTNEEINKLQIKILEIFKKDKYALPLVQKITKYYYPKDLSLPITNSFYDIQEYKIKDMKRR